MSDREPSGLTDRVAIIYARAKNDRKMSEAWHSADAFDEFQPIDHRHFEIENAEIEMAVGLRQQPPRLRAIVRYAQLNLRFGRKQVLQQRTAGIIIISD